MRDLGGVIVCGGKSSRMGSPKAWIDAFGDPMLARVARALSPIAAPIVVVAAAGQALPILPASVVVLRDPIDDLGPLAAVATGLTAIAAEARAAIVCSTDLPFFEAIVAERLAALRGDHDAAVPEVRGHLRPLAAVYATRVGRVAASLIASGERRMRALCAAIDARVVTEETLLDDRAIALADPDLRSFEDVNTPEDIARVLGR